MNRDQWKRYIKERGLVPYTQRQENCPCVHCKAKLEAAQLADSQRAAINAINTWEARS